MRNAKRSMAFAALVTVGGWATIASAVAPTVDGTLDAGLYTRFATQTVGTGFGDNQSELDAGYYRVDGGKLYLFLAGNVESNNNHLAIFFDTRAGGQNTIGINNPNVDFDTINQKYGGLDPTTGTSAHGFTFDAGFSPDYYLSFNRGNDGTATTQGYVNYSELNTNGGGTGGYLGPIVVPTNVPSAQQQGSGTVGGTGGLPSVTLGYNDANTGGVDGTNNAADPVAANAVTTGTEIAIDLATLDITGDFKIAALINGTGSDYLSNQALNGFAGGQGDLGGDGVGGYNGNVAGLDLNNFTGNQFATISVNLPTYTYNIDADSNYSSLSAFTPSGVVPTGGDGRVVFGSKITANRTVTIDQDITLTNLTFDNSHSYTLAGTHTVTIAGNASIDAVQVLSGSHTISAPVTFANDTRIGVAASSSLALTGTVTATGINLFKDGTGGLTMPATVLNSLTVNGGILHLTTSGNTVVRGLTINTTTNPGTAIDLTNGALIVDYDDGFSPLATIKAAIAAGAIVSSTRTSSAYGVGYLDTAASPATVSYGTTQLDANALIFRVTLKGDTNLSQKVDFNDLVTLAQNYGTVPGKEWYQGDFTGDGLVNFNDLVPLAQNYNGTDSPAVIASSFGSDFASDWKLALALAPEPTSLSALALLSGLVIRRRK